MKPKSYSFNVSFTFTGVVKVLATSEACAKAMIAENVGMTCGTPQTTLDEDVVDMTFDMTPAHRKISRRPR